jgi:hypothetical protein
MHLASVTFLFTPFVFPPYNADDDSRLLHVDNAKSFGTPIPELSILASLSQCCIIRHHTFSIIDFYHKQNKLNTHLQRQRKRRQRAIERVVHRKKHATNETALELDAHEDHDEHDDMRIDEGALMLSVLMRASLSTDPLGMFLTDALLMGLDEKIDTIMSTVLRCIKEKGTETVINTTD